jgi:hypothetical protein
VLDGLLSHNNLAAIETSGQKQPILNKIMDILDLGIDQKLM